jgi:hypothetical protein
VSGYELAAYEPGQREDYLRLLRDAWGEAALTGAEFDWWFSRNPEGSLMSVARDDGRVIGVAAHSIYRMALGGGQRPATFSVHATTDPIARGRGIFVGLERKHEDEAKAKGASVVLRSRRRPLRRSSSDRSAGRRSRSCVSGRVLFPVSRCDAAAQSASSVSSSTAMRVRRWPNHIVRSAEYLNWRYLDSPRDYVAYRSGDGYAVLGHKRHRGRPIALVADLVGPYGRSCAPASRA